MTEERIPIILDTDIGGDIDDTWALVMLLNSPEMDVKLITCSTGDTNYRARIVAKTIIMVRYFAVIATLFAIFSTPCNAANPLDLEIDGHQAVAWTPHAYVFNDTLYCYTDYDEFTCSWVWSSYDLVHWTFHGPALERSKISWSRPDIWGFWTDGCYLKNGTYYYYFGAMDTLGNFRMGCATGPSPSGPFTDIGHPLNWTANESHVFIDDDGQAYVYGNSDMIAKLNDNMVEVDVSSVHQLDYGNASPVHGGTGCNAMVEGAWIHKRNGIYYFSWSVGSNPDSQAFYSTATNIYGPYTFQGAFAKAPHCAPEHHSIVEYHNRWYYFYQQGYCDLNNLTDTTCEAPPGIFGGGGWLSCIEYLYYNSNGTIRPIIYTLKGVADPDTISPTITQVLCQGDLTKVSITFDKPMDKASVEDPQNYSLSNGAVVKSGILQNDSFTVVLAVSPALVEGKTYTITAKNIKDSAPLHNIIDPGTVKTFLPLIPHDIPNTKLSAIATSFQPGFEPNKAIDGDPATMWISDSSSQSQSITIDMGNTYVVSALRCRDSLVEWYSISVSVDSENFTQAAKGFWYPSDTVMQKQVAFTPVTARWLRLTSNFWYAVMWACSPNTRAVVSELVIEGSKHPTIEADIAATPDSGTAPFTVQFDGSGSISSNGITSYNWDFGDGSTGKGAKVNHTYTVGGILTAELTIRDSTGNTNTQAIEITVNGPNKAPVAIISATPTSGNVPLSISFDASKSSDSDGYIAQYNWDFGDGTKTSGVNPTHIYTDGGTYTVKLTVSDNGQATGTGTISITAIDTTPAAPSNLKAAFISDTQVILNWTDNSNNEKGFTIEISTDGLQFTKLDSPGANQTAYSVSKLIKGTQYYFRICAYNTTGTSSYSNMISPLLINGISNMSFEAPFTDSFIYRPTDGVWTFTGGAGVQTNGSSWGSTASPDGSQSCFLQMSAAISQAVNFPSLGSYAISFYSCQRNTNGQNQQIIIKIDGSAIDTIQPTSTNFALFISKLFFISAAGQHTIELDGINNSGDNTAFVDYVNLTRSSIENQTAVVNFRPNNKRISVRAELASSKLTNRRESSSLWDADNRVAALNDMKGQNISELFARSDNPVMTNDKTDMQATVTQSKQESSAEGQSGSVSGVKAAQASEEKKNNVQSIRKTNDTQEIGLKIASVRASSFRGKNVPLRTIDNNDKTWWTPGSRTNQWIEYDLGTVKPVSVCSITTYQRSKKPVKFTIETSVDNKTFTSVYNGQFSKTGKSNCCRFPECNAQFIRIRIDDIANPKDLNIYEVAFGQNKERVVSKQ